MPSYYSAKDDLVKIFEDTLNLCKNEPLKSSIQKSIDGTIIYNENNAPALPTKRFETTAISVNKYRTFETAQYYQRKNPNAKIAVLNFASATNVGGGVTRGSKAQEESLCRCSTLYPVLNTDNNLKNFYEYHKKRRDSRYTDRCIYTPDIFVFKSDIDFPKVLPEKNWIKIDVITCAAPNLHFSKTSDDELYKIHLQRAEHILTIAAYHGADIFIGGAFGCGAFQNNPDVVAKAYKETVAKFAGHFQEIVFAVYCSPKDSGQNYNAFDKILNKEAKN